MPVYIEYLKSLSADAPANISATTLAAALGMGEVQVRKDLAVVSTSGKPKIGYIVTDLISELENYLGYNNMNDAIIIGAGKLGKALLDYSGFSKYGLSVLAAFDIDESLAGKTDSNKCIFPLSKLGEFCQRLKVRIGIITVPAESAQSACDLMIKEGILAIWNFAPRHLIVPPGILVQNENMASTLALLSKHLAEQMEKDKKNR